MNFLNLILEPQALVSAVGAVGVTLVIFAETGLFFGFFLPGDSLLFTAGFLASQGYVSLTWLLVGTFIAAVIGDNVGYLFGKRVGPSIFTRDESLFFNKKNITRAQEYYEVHGKKTIILARFIPIIRTFAPIVAGVGSMNYRTFFIYNVIGGFIWTWGLLWGGYLLGRVIPNPDRFIIPVVIIIVIVSALPALREIFKRLKS